MLLFTPNSVASNDYLQFAILTGCLRISKESIFTGLNNFEVVPIMDSMYDECFGFTDKEVQEILKYFNRSEHYTDVREWYDGYHFGNTDIYCDRICCSGIQIHKCCIIIRILCQRTKACCQIFVVIAV